MTKSNLWGKGLVQLTGNSGQELKAGTWRLELKLEALCTIRTKLCLRVPPSLHPFYPCLKSFSLEACSAHRFQLLKPDLSLGLRAFAFEYPFHCAVYL